MAHPMTVTLLGTCSGGGPNESRNCSSLVVDCLRDGSLWMKLFITHMHADHAMGVVTILRTILFASPTPVSVNTPPKIEIYGPAGIRTFVRSLLKLTLTQTAQRYVAHELLRPEDTTTPCEPPEVMHSSELVGRDIRCSDDGFWRTFTQGIGALGPVVVDAGPILHRDPCLGYIIREPATPARKLVILGDTYDPSPIIPLCTAPSLLIHEATDAHIPCEISPRNKRTPESVLRSTLARGHSIPSMAGEFARTISAEKLILNHIGGRFPAPRRDSDRWMHVMREMERQATDAWGSGQDRDGKEAVAAWDFMRVTIPALNTKKRKRRSGYGAVHLVTTTLNIDFSYPSCKIQAGKRSRDRAPKGNRRWGLAA
ncbi:beta-lactamase-like protein [Mycena galericulata]|nr:beta-lactamase-like protein [Mycena galericulata]